MILLESTEHFKLRKEAYKSKRDKEEDVKFNGKI